MNYLIKLLNKKTPKGVFIFDMKNLELTRPFIKKIQT